MAIRYKKKRIRKPGMKCFFIGKTEETGSRIVYYDGTIVEVLGDQIKCRFKDRNIDKTKHIYDGEFEKIFHKDLIKLHK